MAWIDWLKDVPISEVVKQRLALKEEQFDELKQKNEEFVKRIGILEAENTELKKKLKTQDKRERFVDFRGVLWKRKLGGGFECIPFCPSCNYVMTATISGYICRRCRIETSMHDADVALIISELAELSRSQ